MSRDEAWVSFLSRMLERCNWKDDFDLKLVLKIADQMEAEFSKRFDEKHDVKK